MSDLKTRKADFIWYRDSEWFCRDGERPVKKPDEKHEYPASIGIGPAVNPTGFQIKNVKARPK